MADTFSSTILTLGEPRYPSPLGAGSIAPVGARFVSISDRIRYRVETTVQSDPSDAWSFEKAGPRSLLYFEPSRTTAAIVTCGGLSPGINNVIRSLVLELCRNYRIRRVLGYRFGLSAFTAGGMAAEVLTLERVRDIHKLGGSILGSSRGPAESTDIVNRLVQDDVQILFFVGGDGTQRAAHKVAEEVTKRNLPISIIGIPKTIDNDVPFVYTSFGFATAVEESSKVIQAAGVEARSYKNTVSLVKLMGRNAGFIAAHASLAAQEADFVLIPELEFGIDGSHGLLSRVEQKIAAQGYAIVVMAEGAGQSLFDGQPDNFDASGNRLQHDIGSLLREKVEQHFRSRKIPLLFRYFDPGYSIRAVPANVADAYYCDLLSRAAVHAGMAGNTDMLVGQWYNNLTHVPLTLCTNRSKKLSPAQSLWRNVLSVTGQPEKIG